MKKKYSLTIAEHQWGAASSITDDNLTEDELWRAMARFENDPDDWAEWGDVVEALAVGDEAASEDGVITLTVTRWK